jgi:hypothetical protein
MTDIMPVFVNERRVEVPQGATAAAAAACFDPAFVADASGPSVTITDARGLPVAPETVLTTGAILRVAARVRRAGGADAES